METPSRTEAALSTEGGCEAADPEESETEMSLCPAYATRPKPGKARPLPEYHARTFAEKRARGLAQRWRRWHRMPTTTTREDGR